MGKAAGHRLEMARLLRQVKSYRSKGMAVSPVSLPTQESRNISIMLIEYKK